MKTIIKLAAAAALSMGLAGGLASPAFAQDAPGSADTGAEAMEGGRLDNPEFWKENSADMAPGVMNMMYDAQNETLRTDDEFAAMWEEATPEDQEAFREACAEWEQDATLFTDRIRTRCEMAN